MSGYRNRQRSSEHARSFGSLHRERLGYGIGSCYAKACQRGSGICGAISIGIDVRRAMHTAEDANHPAVVRCGPKPTATIIVARRHSTADREAEKVVHVNQHRLSELPLGPGAYGFINTELHGICVTARGRQLSRHCCPAIRTDSLLGGADVKPLQRLRTAVWKGHHGLCARREEERGLTAATFICD